MNTILVVEDDVSLAEFVESSLRTIGYGVARAADVRSGLAAVEAGADDHLTKPFDTLELIARIRTVLGRTGKDRRGLGATLTIERPPDGGLSVSICGMLS